MLDLVVTAPVRDQLRVQVKSDEYNFIVIGSSVLRSPLYEVVSVYIEEYEGEGFTLNMCYAHIQGYMSLRNIQGRNVNEFTVSK